MKEIRQTDAYRKWFDKLRDLKAKARINIRIRRLSLGNPGDVKSVGEGISELQIMHGPGYWVYFTARNEQIIVLLAGCDKSTQSKDIEKAQRLAQNLE